MFSCGTLFASNCFVGTETLLHLFEELLVIFFVSVFGVVAVVFVLIIILVCAITIFCEIASHKIIVKQIAVRAIPLRPCFIILAEFAFLKLYYGLDTSLTISHPFFIIP